MSTIQTKRLVFKRGNAVDDIKTGYLCVTITILNSTGKGI